MARKNDKHGIGQLMTAVADLSNFAMATSTTAIAPPAILKPSAGAVAPARWPTDTSSIDKYNWLLHIMYARGDYDRVQQFIQNQSHKSVYMTYVQALVYRQEGRILEALEYFQKCYLENPSLINIKQVAKSLALIGRHRLAIDAYRDALTRTDKDWEICHNLGLCYLHLNELKEAKQYLLQAVQVSDIQEASYIALGRVHMLQSERDEAEVVYERGAKRNSESPELFTQLGLMAFEKGNYTKAFECFGTALTFSPTYAPAIMAACQVIQKHGDADVALSKYRIVYGRKPECAQVWNNIGMCFFSKKKFVAAVSCLKRANYLAPFELFVLYNLALVHLHLQQNASAAVFLQSAIRLNKKHALSYALLGVALSKLNDPENALRAFTYSLKLDPTDPVTLLNLAILQSNTNASQSIIDSTLKQFHQHCSERVNSTTQRESDPAMLDIANKLGLSTPSASLFAPSEDPSVTLRQTSQEIPTVKTRIYEDERQKQRRPRHLPKDSANTEPSQNEQSHLAV